MDTDDAPTPRITTVGELIARLREFDEQLPISAAWDTMDDWQIHRVDLHPDPSQQRVVIDVGDGDGDWEYLVSEANVGREQRR